ncbi:MAG: pilus assembly PilX N-terminal domain-containing protein [Methylococcales bacterium]|nr:pilus assembly PilX N-terminal domain-containing protein [Methylococcales bacterium]
MKNQYLQKQQGMATLIVSIVVLIITTLMVLMAAKVGIFDFRMAANEARYKEAFATAEAGLDFAVQKFDDQFRHNFDGTAASWTTIINNSQVPNGRKADGTAAGAGEASFGVSITDTGALIGGVSVYRFQSTGLSADGTGTATVQREITMKKILGGSSPEVSVMAAGSVGTGGDFNIVANPNGAGNGIPVSIWTGGPSPNGDVTFTGNSAATCQLGDFNGTCSNPSGEKLSSKGNVGPDILANDPNFPHDIFQYMFGVARGDWETIYSMANSNYQVADNCTGLSATSGQKFRLWWITGDCNISGITIGSETAPVILVIDDHTLVDHSNGTFYGIPYIFDNPSNPGIPSADFGGTPVIYGALVSDAGGGAMQGSYSVVYDSTLLGNIASPNNSANYGIGYIPGSWRDF